MWEYLGYQGRAEFNDDSGIWHGEVNGIRDVITFDEANPNELEQAFRESIDDYLEFCRKRNEGPDRPIGE